MFRLAHSHGLFAALACLLCVSCAGSQPSLERPARYEARMRQLQEKLARNPENAEVLRDIGILYLRGSQYVPAYEHLQMAFARNEDDPETLFHLGMAAEIVGQQDTALRLYSRYPTVGRLSPYRKLLQGRYNWLLRLRARDEMKERLAEETRTGGGQVSPRVVAVFPFTFQGNNSRYEPLGRGLAEMITVDLANVKELTVVERVRLQALLDEIALGQSGHVDASTAPRAGKLLGAGRVVGGNYDILRGDQILVNAAVMELPASTTFAFDTDSRTDALKNLFQLEKEIVFSLIQQMGVQLTPEEQEQIETIPTQNLQAFLAFSRGLEQEDEGDFSGAATFFRQAAQLDPGFGAAAVRAEEAEGLEAASGDPENVLAEVYAATEPPDLVENRIRSLNASVGAGFVPGEDTRKSVQEAPPLPLPPPPSAGQ